MSRRMGHRSLDESSQPSGHALVQAFGLVVVLAVVATAGWRVIARKPTSSVTGNSPFGQDDSREPPSSESSSSKTPGSRRPADGVGEADQVLRAVMARYLGADSYRDRVRLTMTHEVPDALATEMTEVTSRFVRPNRLRIEAVRQQSRLSILCDGSTAWSMIEDPENGDFDRQVVKRVMDGPPTVADLYTMTELIDPNQPERPTSAWSAIPGQLHLSPVTWLLGDPSLVQLLDSNGKDGTRSSLQRLNDATIDGRRLARLQLDTVDGIFIFWVDTEKRVLRRLEYPPLTREDGTVEDSAVAQSSVVTRLVADFHNVQFNAPGEAAAFDYRPPSESRIVKHFVIPPDRPTTGPLGTTVPSFTVTGLNGRPVNPIPDTENVNVLVWFTRHNSSRVMLEQMSQVAELIGADSGVRFMGLCSEPTTSMSHQEVDLLRVNWGVDFPIYRDLQAVGRDRLEISQAPTLVILGPNRIVELFEVGANPRLAEQLPIVLKELRAGESTAVAYLTYLEEQAEIYEQCLREALHDRP